MPFIITVRIDLINDNQPILMLNGAIQEVNFSTVYYERQPGSTNPTQIFLSNQLEIADEDVGPQFLQEVNIRILESKLIDSVIMECNGLQWITLGEWGIFTPLGT